MTVYSLALRSDAMWAAAGIDCKCEVTFVQPCRFMWTSRSRTQHARWMDTSGKTGTVDGKPHVASSTIIPGATYQDLMTLGWRQISNWRDNTWTSPDHTASCLLVCPMLSGVPEKQGYQRQSLIPSSHHRDEEEDQGQEQWLNRAEHKAPLAAGKGLLPFHSDNYQDWDWIEGSMPEGVVLQTLSISWPLKPELSDS